MREGNRNAAKAAEDEPEQAAESRKDAGDARPDQWRGRTKMVSCQRCRRDDPHAKQRAPEDSPDCSETEAA